MLQITSSRLVENYLLNRKDAQCDSLRPETEDVQVMRGFDGEWDDILICPNLPPQTGNADEMVREWSRIMKSGGVCLVFPTSGREWLDNKDWLAASGLCLNEVGEEWFGAEFYQTCGLDSGMLLPVLTKDGPLSEL